MFFSERRYFLEVKREVFLVFSPFGFFSFILLKNIFDFGKIEGDVFIIIISTSLGGFFFCFGTFFSVMDFF